MKIQYKKTKNTLISLKFKGVERAKKVIQDARKLGVPPCIQPNDIVNAVSKLNLIHCAHIFNHCPGLTPTEEEIKIASAALIDDDNDPEASREERGRN